MNAAAYPPRTVLRILPSCLLLFLVGCLDSVTGREIHIGSGYLLVVAIASWNMPPLALILFAAATVVWWSSAEWMSGVHFSRSWIVYWNAVNHLGVVAITASMVSKAKTTLDRQQRLIRDLGQALLKINQFKELVPVCRVCHELHLDDGYQTRLDELLDEGVDMDSIGDICPACLAERAARVATIPVDAYFNSPVPQEAASRHAGSAGNGASPPRSAPPAAANETRVP